MLPKKVAGTVSADTELVYQRKYRSSTAEMRGKITKTEKILAVCTVVFLLAVCGFCFSEIAAGGNGEI